MRAIPAILLVLSTVAQALHSQEDNAKPAVSKEPREPNAKEQLFVYLLNKARSDPPAYGKQINVDLTGTAWAQPFAVNKNLMRSAEFRAHDMFTRGYFGHVDPGGIGPNLRVLEGGYPLARIYSRDAVINNVEAIAAGTDSPAKTLAYLVEDKGVPDLSHRKHLMNLMPFCHAMREIGVGYFEPGPGDRGGEAMARYRSFCAVHTAHRDTTEVFVTGVVYNDKNQNSACDEGEGLEGVEVIINNQKVLTMKAGGYAIAVKAGPVVVGCHLGTFQGQATANVVVDTRNVHLEFISGRKDGIVNFGKPMPAAGR